jgi:hypothetical protein
VYIGFMDQVSAVLNAQAPVIVVNGTATGGNVPNAGLWNTLTGDYLPDPASVTNMWDYDGFSAFLFSFELLTTIGYGEISPKTVGGRLWLCLYSLLTIPIGGVCLSRIASIVIDMCEWLAQVVDSHQRALFHAYDQDNDGYLNDAEARHALESIQGSIDDMSFREAFDAAHVLRRNPAGLTCAEFCRLFMNAENPQLQHRRRWRKLYVSSFAVCIWLIMGMLVFDRLEEWGHLPSFYFCVVTLTTVGLGDLYPTTEDGEAFHFFYCVTGLGLVAVLLTAIADCASEDAIEDDEEIRQIASLLTLEPAPGGGRLDARLLGLSVPPKETAAVALKESKKVDVTLSSLASLSSSSKQRALRELLSYVRDEPWLPDELLAYVPLPKAPPPPPPPPPGPVIKVFGPEFPTGKGRAGGSGPVVPHFKPSYTQLYDDEPFNLSGAPKPGFPLYDDPSMTRALNGRSTGYDPTARDVSHGPYEPDDGLTGQVLGQLAIPQRGSAGNGGWGLSGPDARRTGYNGPDGKTLGDDGKPWEEGTGGGSRPRGASRFREIPANRL